METMYDRLGDLLSESLKSGHIKEKKHSQKNQKNFFSPDEKAEKEKREESEQKKKQDFHAEKKEIPGQQKKQRIKKITAETERACRLLDITLSAEPADVKRAYKEKLLYFHPDKYDKNPILRKIATDKTRMIVEAYKLLMNSFEPL
ncbi:J domain-containing protein [Treponema sp.]|uniref:J domain-containing protein n=1 Tax=Treponema sp. TaxID=166 RepID=UPI003F0550AA